VYQQHCHLDKVPMARGGARVQFPAALCVEEAVVDQQRLEEFWGVAAAAADAAPLVGLPALSDVEQLVSTWKANVGGLVVFANLCREQGVSLQTPDGRVFLPGRVLMDTGCEQGLIDGSYGLSMGLLPTPVAPRELITADGGRFQVSHKITGLGVVLAMGTDDELSVPQDFWVVKGLGKLAQVIFPTTLDHACGGGGVDRLLGVYNYRPRLAHGDLRVAMLPVVSHQVARGPHAAAVGVLAHEVQALKPDPAGEAGSAASGARQLVFDEPADEFGRVEWAVNPPEGEVRASREPSVADLLDTP
jgi:hypothetical protein